jgi:hypothetical protein
VRDFRQNLRASVAASAAPYGYTLTVWSSGMVALTRLGHPALGDVLLFVAGSVSGFLAIEVGAYGSLQVRLTRPPPPLIAVFGNAHIISAGVSVVAVWAIDHALSGHAGWVCSGFAATVCYLLLNAAQTTFATRMEEMAHREDLP